MLARIDKQTKEHKLFGKGAVEQYMTDFEIKSKRTARAQLFELYHNPAIIYIQNTKIAWSIHWPDD